MTKLLLSIDDRVRVTRKNPCGAKINHNSRGVITKLYNEAEEPYYEVSFSGGRFWYIGDDDLALVD